jgi:hypothetical protein
LNFGHENTAKKLSAVISNAAYLSKMATGDMEITDRKARAVEKELGLPVGWMDRDNVAFLKTPADDYSLLQVLTTLRSEAKPHLERFIASARVALPRK